MSFILQSYYVYIKNIVLFLNNVIAEFIKTGSEIGIYEVRQIPH